MLGKLAVSLKQKFHDCLLKLAKSVQTEDGGWGGGGGVTSLKNAIWNFFDVFSNLCITIAIFKTEKL